MQGVWGCEAKVGLALAEDAWGGSPSEKQTHPKRQYSLQKSQKEAQAKSMDQQSLKRRKT